MYFSTEDKPKCGQGFRDKVRCEALESLGYEVFTLDDKHKENNALKNRHCEANFADHLRMFKSISNRWPDIMSGTGFGMIILDYFFSPAGWVEHRWTENFFRKTLPFLAEKNVLTEGGLIWLPHVNHVNKMLEVNRTYLEENYVWQEIRDPTRNPLYRATDNVIRDLQLCPDNMTNETQRRPLMESGTPFFVLRRLKASELLDSSSSSPATSLRPPPGVPGRTTRSGLHFSSSTSTPSHQNKKKKRNPMVDDYKTSKKRKSNICISMSWKKSNSSSQVQSCHPSIPSTPPKLNMGMHRGRPRKNDFGTPCKTIPHHKAIMAKYQGSSPSLSLYSPTTEFNSL